MSYFKHHVFFCCNQRPEGQPCCNNHGAEKLFEYAKVKIFNMKLDYNRIRMNKAGCLDRCAGGPVAVVYPEAVWYTFIDESDIDEIIESHLKHGKVVERLRIPAHMGR